MAEVRNIWLINWMHSMRGKTCHVVTRVTANGNIYRGDFCVVFACKKFDLFLSSEDLHMLVLTLMPSTQVLHSVSVSNSSRNAAARIITSSTKKFWPRCSGFQFIFEFYWWLLKLHMTKHPTYTKDPLKPSEPRHMFRSQSGAPKLWNYYLLRLHLLKSTTVF